MAVREEKILELRERMARLEIQEKDLLEKFITGSGRGGQKVNKTNSCVYLKHIPTGIDVKCQKDRSREINRFLARRELCERFEAEVLGKKSPQKKQLERIRRQKKRRRRRGEQKSEETEK